MLSKLQNSKIDFRNIINFNNEFLDFNQIRFEGSMEPTDLKNTIKTEYGIQSYLRYNFI